MNRREGWTAAEVLVGLLLTGLAGLLCISALPGLRARAREASCRRNLSQIGIALALHDQTRGHLPGVPALERDSGPGADPLAKLLAAFGQADFEGFRTLKEPPSPAATSADPAARLPGLICPDDSVARRLVFSAPSNYRAVTGDQPAGGNGAFAPGQRLSLADIERGDGLAHTALYEERLVGSGREGQPSVRDYAVVPGLPGEGGPWSGNPAPVGSAWRGDAGSQWGRASWISGLANHSLRPNEAPSLISASGVSARIGASSGHRGGVHVLRGDLSVIFITSAVDRRIWAALARLHDAAPGH